MVSHIILTVLPNKKATGRHQSHTRKTPESFHADLHSTSHSVNPHDAFQPDSTNQKNEEESSEKVSVC